MINPYLKDLKTTVFDIETMGLMPYKDMIISASFYDPAGGSCVSYFADSPANEINLILDILNKLSENDVVVTYNGDSFDLPFVLTRAKKYKLCDKLPLLYSCDMYRILKKYWPMAQTMKSLRQKAVEIALGLADDRTDEIPGSECISLYNQYIAGINDRAKDLILLHNKDDVRQLGSIYTEISSLPFDRIAFEQGFPVRANELILIKEIKLDRNYFYITAMKEPGGIPSSIYEDEYELEYDCFTGRIDIRVRLSRKDNTYYTDLTLLPVEPSDFKDLSGFHSDFIVLSDENGVKYREANELALRLFNTQELF